MPSSQPAVAHWLVRADVALSAVTLASAASVRLARVVGRLLFVATCRRPLLPHQLLPAVQRDFGEARLARACATAPPLFEAALAWFTLERAWRNC